MKKTITTFASIAIAATAAAHTTAIPHDHSGASLSWMSIIVASACVGFAALSIAAIRKKGSPTK